MRRLLPVLIAFLALTAFFAAAPSADAAWVWPVAGKVITPYRNGTDPYAAGQHRGIDIAAPVGTPVVAATAGEVRFAGTAGSSGLTISIRTADGYDTSYLHLSSLVDPRGRARLGGPAHRRRGITGVRSATAPHLHFGVRDAGTRHDYHDPLAFLPPPPAPHAPPAPRPARHPRPRRPRPRRHRWAGRGPHRRLERRPGRSPGDCRRGTACRLPTACRYPDPLQMACPPPAWCRTGFTHREAQARRV